MSETMGSPQSEPMSKAEAGRELADLAAHGCGCDETGMFPERLVVTAAEADHVRFAGRPEPYLDLIQGYSSSNLGHRHPAVIGAAQRALAEVDHVFSFPGRGLGPLCHRLTALCGLDGGRVYLDVGGHQIALSALRLARTVTGRSRTASFHGAFHGHGCELCGLSSAFTRLEPATACPHHDILPWNREEALERVAAGGYAAVLLEPILGAAGYLVPDPPWVRGLRAACDHAGTLLVADEIQVGLGRTGLACALDRFDVRADAYLFSKSLGGGVYPLSALVARGGLLERIPADCGAFGSTFSNSQWAVQLACAVIDLINDPALLAGVIERGDLAAAAWNRRAPAGFTWRHLGLALAVDCPDAATARAVRDAAFAEQMLVYVSGLERRTLKLSPSLIIDPELLSRAVSRLATIAARAACSGG